MKTVVTIILLAVVILLIIATSCTKEYVENPSCRRYLQLSDKYNSEMIYLRTDTLWPNGRIANYACDGDLLKIQNFKPHKEGCETGWQQFRYIIL